MAPERACAASDPKSVCAPPCLDRRHGPRQTWGKRRDPLCCKASRLITTTRGSRGMAGGAELTNRGRPCTARPVASRRGRVHPAASIRVHRHHDDPAWEGLYETVHVCPATGASLRRGTVVTVASSGPDEGPSGAHRGRASARPWAAHALVADGRSGRAREITLLDHPSASASIRMPPPLVPV